MVQFYSAIIWIVFQKILLTPNFWTAMYSNYLAIQSYENYQFHCSLYGYLSSALLKCCRPNLLFATVSNCNFSACWLDMCYSCVFLLFHGSFDQIMSSAMSLLIMGNVVLQKAFFSFCVLVHVVGKILVKVCSKSSQLEPLCCGLPVVFMMVTMQFWILSAIHHVPISH